MSETPANRSRARRRVVRRAGPPVEGDSASIEVQESGTGAVRPEPAAIEVAEPGSVAGAASAAATDAEPVAAGSAGATPAAEDSDVPSEPSNEPVAEDKEASAVAVDADAVADSETESKSRVRRIVGSLGRMGTVAAVVALVSMLVLLGSTGVYFYHGHRADELSQRRAEYIQVAKQAYIDMSTVKDSTADQDIDRLLSVAGGGLKDEYSQNRDAYKKVFEQMKVQSTGTIISAAIESDDADSASVLLLAQQTVSNVSTNGPMQRDYRVRVHVTRTANTVTASGLEFVP
ncbi:MAG: hypothetical protein JWN03_8149 [Nocardia sp.]|uniref:hypothetical protein n=1 Tax=Nocardia sp. TaxID=1821 RepID=UPI0026018BE8|nr:hypothetical protein [Nocardia sp.]MCU1647874.1 hypothetical protein [Nocardia sp.]